jgi:hypothetical protein
MQEYLQWVGLMFMLLYMNSKLSSISKSLEDIARRARKDL